MLSNVQLQSVRHLDVWATDIDMSDIRLRSGSASPTGTETNGHARQCASSVDDSVESFLNHEFEGRSEVLLSDDDITLMYAKHERIPLKDFSVEVRASKDIRNFLKQAVLLLDLHESSLENIIDAVLVKLLDAGEHVCTYDEARESIFTHDSVHTLSRTIQGTSVSEGGHDYDQSWICAVANLPSLERRHVAIARLRQSVNLGSTSQEIKFVIVVLAPTKEKGTKDAVETGRTFATIFADMELRQQLIESRTEEEFKDLLWLSTQRLAEVQGDPSRKSSKMSALAIESNDQHRFRFGAGILGDLKNRIPLYISDYTDGILGRHTLHKTLSATVFLYFACIMPSIAFGVLNDQNTKGMLGVRKVILSQTICGLLFSMFGGQPLIVLLTTAPLALYTKVIFLICEDFGLDFPAMFACVGLWNMFFLLLYSFFNISFLMKWSTRSTEEIFALFIAIAFSVDAFKDLAGYFDKKYFSCGVLPPNNYSLHAGIAAAGINGSNVTEFMESSCARDSSMLYLLLMFGTLWVGVQMYNFTQTPFLNENKREILADYALPVAVVTMSFVGSWLFKDVPMQPFKYNPDTTLTLPDLHKLSVGAVFAAAGLGFCLSLLFFMDQNITSALVNAPSNKLKKPAAYHWDLCLVAAMNGFLSLFGLPWVHGALPHSPLHVKALADIEARVDNGHLYQLIVRVRETRLSTLFAHVLIGLSLLLLPYPIAYIPHAVLDGLFLYVAFTSLQGNQLFERIKLVFTEQAAYPPSHYIRRVPQRIVHKFTGIQLMQLLVLCVFGFTPWPYIKMMFPPMLMILMPIRHKILPKLMNAKYIEILDGHM